MIVGARGGRPVLLREVAEVVDTFEEQTRVVTADGHPAVLLAVRKQSDANTVQVSRAALSAPTLNVTQVPRPMTGSISPLEGIGRPRRGADSAHPGAAQR